MYIACGLLYLANNVLVREADYHAILWSVVFVFVLSDEPLASIIISFAL